MTTYNWREIKEKAIDEIKENIAAGDAMKFGISLDKAFELMCMAMRKNIDNKEYDGIYDSVLSSLYTSYHDEFEYVQKKNAFEILSEKIEPFIKKILIIISDVHYKELCEKHKKQEKCDPMFGELLREFEFVSSKKHLEYKDINNIDPTLYKFEQHVIKAYMTRNKVAHLSPKMNKKNFYSLLESIILTYIYAIFKYHKELCISLEESIPNENKNDLINKYRTRIENFYKKLCDKNNDRTIIDDCSQFYHIEWSSDDNYHYKDLNFIYEKELSLFEKILCSIDIQWNASSSPIDIIYNYAKINYHYEITRPSGKEDRKLKYIITDDIKIDDNEDIRIVHSKGWRQIVSED